MKKLLFSLMLGAMAIAIVGCNAGETPVVEVQTQKTSQPATPGAGAGAPNIPDNAKGSIPSNAIPPPPAGR